MYKGKECRGCPVKWNPDSCDPEKRKHMDMKDQEPILEVDKDGNVKTEF